MGFLKRLWSAPTPLPAPSPLPEEVASWLKNDFTLREAGQAHVEKWFGKDKSGVHEFAHVIYALSGNTPYQATYEAETYVLAVEDALKIPYLREWSNLKNANEFSDYLQRYAKDILGLENFNRTLIWSIGKMTGQTQDQIRAHAGHEDKGLRALAEQHGLILSFDDPALKFWNVQTPENQHFEYHERGAPLLPQGTNGVETFTPYIIPDHREIKSRFYQMQPALKFLQDRMKIAWAEMEARRDRESWVNPIGDVKVRDLYTLMHGEKPRLSYQEDLSL